jgi:hypothetical protein
VPVRLAIARSGRQDTLCDPALKREDSAPSFRLRRHRLWSYVWNNRRLCDAESGGEGGPDRICGQSKSWAEAARGKGTNVVGKGRVCSKMRWLGLRQYPGRKRTNLTRTNPLMACSTTEIATTTYRKEKNMLKRMMGPQHMGRGEQINHYIGWIGMALKKVREADMRRIGVFLLSNSGPREPGLLTCLVIPPPPCLLLSSNMPPRGSNERLDFTPILTHYLFLFTSVFAVVSLPPSVLSALFVSYSC